MNKDEIRDLISTQVTISIRKVILELFVGLMTTLIYMFDECYAVITDVVAAAATAIVSDVGRQWEGSR